MQIYDKQKTYMPRILYGFNKNLFWFQIFSRALCALY